jgi:hypothetical protein
VDWQAWHDAYEDPESGLSQRLVLVQEQVRAALDRLPPGPIKAISVCAGQGHDLIGALVDHPRRGDVTARLVEFDEGNVLIARRGAQEAGLDGVQVVVGDASLTDAYVGAIPADLVLVCGVFGNILPEDIQRTITGLSQLCAANSTVIWTRHRVPPDITPTIRRWFTGAGFEELAFEIDQSERFAVGAQRLDSPPSESLREDERLFDFVGFWDKALDG